ncbi:STAS domain-containing protein [Rhizorhabdus sp. FW153]|uniref:STAS domain-containing protein n=1 Tax=Rhizorhabdus sp. FW153 TaxID=3400216 RepID=UPI003CEC4488
MQWTEEAQDGAVVAAPAGRVDETTAAAFGTHLEQAVELSAAAGARLIVDFAGVDYMSSRGLRALTLAKRKADAAGVRILLAQPNEIVREILAISRYDKLFGVTDTVEAALTA